MYMDKQKRKTLADMILAHRVAVRKMCTAETGSAEWYAGLTAETATQYALELALGAGEDYMVEYLADATNEDAHVARIRLKTMGVEI